MEQYCDAKVTCGPTNSESQLVGAMESGGLVKQIKRFYFESLAQRVGVEEMSRLLLQDCEVFQPEVIIYSALGGLLGYELNPTDAVLNEIRNRGIKLYTWLWDTEGREWETWERWLLATDGVLIADTIVRAEYYRRDPRIIQCYTAMDSRDFYDSGEERDIDVCFVGGMDPGRWSQRAAYIDFLRSNGINVVAAGGQRAMRLSWKEYSGILRRSKISLNFTVNPAIVWTLDMQMIQARTSQLKGRVFETLSCGAMLMEDDGRQTQEFFEPGEDYVRFCTPEDLLEKVRHYLAHDDERQAIAQSGHEKVTRVFNARNMWGHLFGLMGFEVPKILANDKDFQRHEEAMERLGCL